MGMTGHYRMGPIQVGATPTTIGGITDVGVGQGVQVFREPASGQIGAQVQAVTAIQPTGSFTTQSVEAALTACGSLGSSLFTNPLILYGTKIDQHGAIAASGHYSWTLRGGLLYPVSLSCPHRGNAALSYNATIAYDGTNAPIVASGAATLPATITNKLWTLSAASIGGVGATDVQNVQIDFGLQVAGEAADSDVYDTRLSINAVTPRVTIETNDPSWFTTLGLGGTDITDGTITLRNREDRGDFSEDTMTLTFSGVAYVTDPYRASGQSTGRASVVVDVEYDNTNAPFALS